MEISLRRARKTKGLIKRWILGKDLTELPRPSPKDSNYARRRRTLKFPASITSASMSLVWDASPAMQKCMKTSLPANLTNSAGVMVSLSMFTSRLLNVVDGHFGISPNELRHGTFGRFRLVVHMDGLDRELRSNRESISEGPLLETAQDVLRAIFNAVRPTMEKDEEDEEPGAKLSRKLAASPASLSRRPIVELARAVAEGRQESRYLIVPEHMSEKERESFLLRLESRANTPEEFVTAVTEDMEGTSRDGLVRFDTDKGTLLLNRWHPFVATFHEVFMHRHWGQPLELFAMAEVLAEAHLHSIGVRPKKILEFLSERDQLLRNLANESGRQSALSIANSLSDARNSPDRLEECVCNAFRSLGFDVTQLGERGKPDGVATAHLFPDDSGTPQDYMVSLEAKSKEQTGARVSEKSVNIAAVARHREDYNCAHAVVVGPDFQTTTGEESALGKSIRADRNTSAVAGKHHTITLITVDDLARLVRLRPIKQIGLRKIRELFRECSLPEQCAEWVNSIHEISFANPPYRKIVETVQELQKDFPMEPVRYSGLRVALTRLTPPIRFRTDGELYDLCYAMAQMAPGAIYASPEKVELDQSVENVVAAIETALQDYPPDEEL